MSHKKISIALLIGLLFTGNAFALFGKKAEKAEEAVVVAELPPLKGPKKFIAVNDFENKVENPEGYWYRNPKLGTGMSDMLVTALMDTGYFIVLERQELEAALAEQDLAASGRTTAVGHAKTGKVNQAQYLIQGAVTLFEEGTEKKSGGIGGSFKGVSIGIGGGGGESQVGIDVRVFDTATSQIVAAETCKGFAKSKGRALSLGLSGSKGSIGFGGEDFKKSPLGDATRDAIIAATNFVVFEMNKVPWRGRIMKVTDDGKIYINCGQRNNTEVGEVFNVFKVGDEFVDPDTGESLGAEETRIGSLKVVAVKEKFGIASVESGGPFTIEDIIRWQEA